MSPQFYSTLIDCCKGTQDQDHPIWNPTTSVYCLLSTVSCLLSPNNDLYRSKAATWHDFVQVWMSPDPPKVEEIPEICTKEVVAWDMQVTRVGETLMELMCEGLGLEGRKCKELTFSESRLFLGLCYPFYPQPDLTVGLKSHTDAGTITVLVQNEVLGLQVKHGEDWVDVKPVPGSLIVNVGDLFQILSNGEYNSVQHRVLANSNKEPRISVVNFFNITKWMGSGYYGPPPELLSPEKPPIYRNFTKEEYYENYYKELDSKSLIEKNEDIKLKHLSILSILCTLLPIISIDELVFLCCIRNLT